jgi:hypothetical protein
MIGALKQVEAGRTAEDVAREQGVSKHEKAPFKNCSIYVVGTSGVFRDKVIKKLTNLRCSNS